MSEIKIGGIIGRCPKCGGAIRFQKDFSGKYFGYVDHVKTRYGKCAFRHMSRTSKFGNVDDLIDALSLSYRNDVDRVREVDD